VEDAFGMLVWVVAAVGAIVAVFTLVGTGRSYRQIGGGIVHDEDRAGDEDAPPRASASERDAEIRQLLEARNARHARRGEAAQDVEAELAALTRSPAVVDDDLREEIRQHVVARNARRVRAGAEPIDIEEEIERRIRELT
jgi:hypothetical protein